MEVVICRRMSRREEHAALGGTRKAKVTGKTVGPRIMRVIKGAKVNVKVHMNYAVVRQWVFHKQTMYHGELTQG